MKVISSSSSDYIGAAASFLCVIHCMATPLIFVIQSCTTTNSCCDSAPLWWSAIDYMFIGITFIAVHQSSKNTSKDIMRVLLYGTWAVLTLVIINEKLSIWLISAIWKYLAALLMITTHMYNLKFCQCKKDSYCCSNVV